MKKNLYIECYAGISGALIGAALLDLGADEGFVREQLQALSGGEWDIEIQRVTVQGICALRFLRKGTLWNQEGEVSLEDIRQRYEKACLQDEVRRLALRTFQILADAKGKVSGNPSEDVTFPLEEACEAMTEITVTAACVVNLEVEKIYFSQILDGFGHEKTRDGFLPVPLPTVLAIAEACHMPIVLRQQGQLIQEGACITPVGAALAAALCENFDETPEVLRVIRTGIGTDTDAGISATPPILRALLLKESRTSEQEEKETVCVLETNIDDASGEQLGYAIELLMKAGARDASAIPILMKKHRPAFLLQVICGEEKREEMEHIIFRETTSIGLRRYRESRSVLPRAFEKVETRFGPITCKVCTHHGERFYYPEYEEVARIAEKQGISFWEVYHQCKDCGNSKDIV